MWRGSTGVKRSGVALTSATTPAPVRNLSPSWVVSLSVAASFHTTSAGGTVSRLYMCKSVVVVVMTVMAVAMVVVIMAVAVAVTLSIVVIIIIIAVIMVVVVMRVFVTVSRSCTVLVIVTVEVVDHLQGNTEY